MYRFGLSTLVIRRKVANLTFLGKLVDNYPPVLLSMINFKVLSTYARYIYPFFLISESNTNYLKNQSIIRTMCMTNSGKYLSYFQYRYLLLIYKIIIINIIGLWPVLLYKIK